MSPAGIVEAVDVFEQGHFRLSPCVPLVAPDQFRLQGLEEALDDGVEAPIFVNEPDALFLACKRG
jgi:hypothetical protein